MNGLLNDDHYSELQLVGIICRVVGLHRNLAFRRIPKSMQNTRRRFLGATTSALAGSPLVAAAATSVAHATTPQQHDRITRGQPQEILKPFYSLNLSTAEQKKILTDNARNLFRV